MKRFKDFLEEQQSKLKEDGEAVATNTVGSGNVATYDKPIGDQKVDKRKALETEDDHGPVDGEDPDGKVQGGAL